MSCAEGAGAERGKLNPCVYKHVEKQLSFFHYGDDFFIAGPRKHALWIRDKFGEKFILKSMHADVFFTSTII